VTTCAHTRLSPPLDVSLPVLTGWLSIDAHTGTHARTHARTHDRQPQLQHNTQPIPRGTEPCSISLRHASASRTSRPEPPVPTAPPPPPAPNGPTDPRRPKDQPQILKHRALTLRRRGIGVVGPASGRHRPHHLPPVPRSPRALDAVSRAGLWVVGSVWSASKTGRCCGCVCMGPHVKCMRTVEQATKRLIRGGEARKGPRALHEQE
jgi:hypothetical protein